MPFPSIVIVSGRAFVLPIQILPMQSQNVLCADIVQLSVTVSGDINQHTFEWEQISGTPVALENANTLSPWFVNPNTGDMVFRFWIDRGTPFEKFRDVNIFRELSSVGNNLITGTMLQTPGVAVSNTGSVPFESRLPSNGQVVPTIYADQNGTTLRNEAVLVSGPFMIMWTQPSGQTQYNELLGIQVERWDTNTNQWVLDGFTTFPYYNISNDFAYRLVAVWNDTFRHQISRETDNRIYRSKAGKALNPIQGLVSNGSNLISSSGVTVLNDFQTAGVLLETYTTDATNLISGGSASTGSTIVRYRGVFFDAGFSTATNLMSMAGSHDPDSVVIVRANGLSIGA